MSLIVCPDHTAWSRIPGWTCARLREWYDEVAGWVDGPCEQAPGRIATSHSFFAADGRSTDFCTACGWHKHEPLCPPGGIVVEIGVAYGCSLAYLIARLDDSVRTVGVDIWEDHQGRDQLDTATWERVRGHGTPLQACLGELARSAAYCYGRTTLIQDTGERAAARFADASVDVVFIDEHHTRESVGAAIRAWLPKVKSGGWLSGHDCNDHYPGVLQGCHDELPLTPEGQPHSPLIIRPPYPDDNGWGGVWCWRKP